MTSTQITLYFLWALFVFILLFKKEKKYIPYQLRVVLTNFLHVGKYGLKTYKDDIGWAVVQKNIVRLAKALREEYPDSKLESDEERIAEIEKQSKAKIEEWESKEYENEPIPSGEELLGKYDEYDDQIDQELRKSNEV